MSIEERMDWDRTSHIRYWIAGLVPVASGYVAYFSAGMLGTWLNSQPALQDLHPQSVFLAALNSPSTLANEAVTIPTRIGIVSAATQYDPWVGPFALLTPNPQSAYSYMVGTSSAGLLLFDYGTLLIIGADPQTPWWDTDVWGGAAATSLGLRLYTLGDTYADWIGGQGGDMGDFIVPFERQFYPGATLNQVMFGGPLHHRQTTDAGTQDLIMSRIADAIGG